jgi:biopolymer transport protein ExbD
MSWKLRHEGSPQSVEGLTPQEVVEGLQDGRWEPTDEVMGPQDSDWVPIENHPQFAEVVMDLEPPPPRHEEDESRLDMNALIDVCLVLLIFFILTTSYAALQKMLDSPNLTGENQGPIVIRRDQVQDSMVVVKITQGPKGPITKVEDQVVDKPEDLVPVLRRFVRGRKNEILIDHDRQVPHGAVVAVQDAAKLVHVEAVHILVPKNELSR